MTDHDRDWLIAKFEEHNDEFLKFERVNNKLCGRPDVCAFLLLDQLDPSTRDMVESAEHDQIWLAADPDKIAKIITEEQIIDLVRCGVMFEDWGLSMYV